MRGKNNNYIFNTENIERKKLGQGILYLTDK